MSGSERVRGRFFVFFFFYRVGNNLLYECCKSSHPVREIRKETDVVPTTDDGEHSNTSRC